MINLTNKWQKIDSYSLKRNIDEFENLSWTQLDKISELLNLYYDYCCKSDDLAEELEQLEEENSNLQYDLDSTKSKQYHNLNIITNCIDDIKSAKFKTVKEYEKFLRDLADKLDKYYC